MKVRIGLPYSADGPLLRAAAACGGSVLISANAMWRDGHFEKVGLSPWRSDLALDSAGFTAMRLGGYRWTLSEYVEFVASSGGRSDLPFPWTWWAAMDYCCEPEIAHDRAEVLRRMQLTVTSYADTLDEVDWWRDEGLNSITDPLPVLQGRLPEDYLASAVGILREAERRGREMPTLVGVGSVCRRNLRGPDGLLAIVDVLDRDLPDGVRLHLFGVKGPALVHMPARVESTDSMAWDFAARRVAREAGVPCSVELRAQQMRSWYRTQVEHR